MLVRYPDIKPYRSRQIKVDGLHTVYCEECGNPAGIPVLFVHGGPGAGCEKHDRCYFDPDEYRIVLFDQRGCGRSSPHGRLENNTTAQLIGDMETIRRELGIGHWLVVGGAWGATLSLLYAEAYPQRVRGLVLWSVFLCRRRDFRWFYRHGARHLFPDYWADFVAPLADGERGDPLTAYHRRLNEENELARMAAARAWVRWEARCSTLDPCQHLLEDYLDPHRALPMARLESHYFHHRGFIQEGQILGQVKRLRGIPGTIIHGRYDAVSPLENAYSLYRHWPDAELSIVRDAGHALREPGITDALLRATRDMASRLQ